MVRFLKSQPDKMSFASSGNGSSDHLTIELFWQRTGTTGLHIPYKGGAPTIADLLGGQVDASFHNINAVIPHGSAGKLAAQFGTLGFEIVANTPEQFAAFQQRENTRWKQLIETRRITAD